MGSNLAVIAEGSSTHSASLANPNGGLAAMATQGLGPTTLNTVEGKHQRMGLGWKGMLCL